MRNCSQVLQSSNFNVVDSILKEEREMETRCWADLSREKISDVSLSNTYRPGARGII